ncbi:MAG: sodium:glutamate symporter [Spirochaetales bacterium]|nr:sodium:glutamate symporter [Spirochaetales bacterium]
MEFEWTVFLDIGVISLALLLGTFIRTRVKVFQKYLIPNNLTAGFLLLPYYNWVAPALGFTTTTLENIVFHFLCISFISMILRVSPKRTKKKNPDVMATAVTLTTQYALQCFLGTGLVLLMIFTFMPDLFPGFGLFPTLGYSLGPGQAFAIGKGWEQMGFFGLSDVGLTFGALGFVWACFGGIFLVNYGLRKGWLERSKYEKINEDQVRIGVQRRKGEPHTSRVTDITTPEAIDPLSFNMALVLGTYLLTYLLLKLITWGLSFVGSVGMELAVNLWGIMFIFSALTAMLVKACMGAMKIEYVVDNDRLTRISGFAVDYMVAAAVGAISVSIISEYWLPILILGLVCGVMSTITHIWLSSRIFSDNAFYRSVLCYGAITGTLPTGLALLRIIDPKFETPASRDYMYASGIVFLLVIPIIITANAPAKGALAGSLRNTWLCFAMYGAYLILCLVLYLFLSGNRRFKDPSKIWLRRKDTELI